MADDDKRDERTPDVIEGRRFLSMDRRDAMHELGIRDEAAYRRAYRDVEAAVNTRDNRESQGGVHAPIVIKKKGKRVIDV